jgi:hypothetical protein
MPDVWQWEMDLQTNRWKTIVRSRDAVFIVCSNCMGQRKERQNKVTTRNKEDGQTNTRKKEKPAGTSTQEAIRKSYQATSYCSVYTRLCKQRQLLGNRFLTRTNELTVKRCSVRDPCDSCVTQQ